MKTVFFDRISLIHRPIIFFFLKLNYKIKIFNFSHNLKRCKWLANHINDKKVETIIPLEVNAFHGKAIDDAYDIKDGKLKILTKALKSIISEKDSKNIIRKEYAKLFLEYYSINNLVRNNCLLFQSDFITKKRILEKIKNKKLNFTFKIFKISFIVSFIETIFDFIKWKFVAFFYFLIKISTFIILNFFGKKLEKKIFKFAIPLDQEFQLKFKGKRSFDFFIDDKKFKKKNVLFLVNFNINKKWLKQKKLEGYNFHEITEINNFKNLFIFKHDYSFLINSLIALIKNFITIKPIKFEKIFYQSLNTYLNFSNLFSFFEFKNYIYTNQDSISQNVKNSILKNRNVKSWNYSSFIGGGLLTAKSKKKFKEKRDVLWSFQNSENYLAVNNDVIDYLKLHYQDTQNYYATGTLYSQFVTEYKKEFTKTELLKKIIPNNVKFSKFKKIISFFDTTFISNNNCLTSYNDGIKFCENIFKLSKKYNQIYFIFKNSKNEKFYTDEQSEWAIPSEGNKLLNEWDKLKKSENIFFATDISDPSLIMSASDAVFTHCVSSTWLEALESGILSYWYETRGNFQGSIYSKFIINGIDELDIIVEKILLNPNQLLMTQKKNITKILKYSNFNNRSLSTIRKIIN